MTWIKDVIDKESIQLLHLLWNISWDNTVYKLIFNQNLYVTGPKVLLKDLWKKNKIKERVFVWYLTRRISSNGIQLQQQLQRSPVSLM